MIAQPSDLPEPLPQVGAVLYFDSEIASPDLHTGKQGGKHWKLAGSCVLLTPDRILTIGHILGGREESIAALRKHYAVFFPYEGFFDLSQTALEWEHGQTPGDNLALASLPRPVKHFYPLPHQKIESRYKYDGYSLVCGYGSWRLSPFDRREGLQQQYRVDLGPPSWDEREKVRGWYHYDNLDLSWSSTVNEMTAGRGNSGGPFLWGKNGTHTVVGISREVKADQQVGSWIGWERKHWLDRKVSEAPAPVQNGSAATTWRPLSIAANKGEVVQLEVPTGATRVQATLNASQGIRLQMDVVPANQANGLLGRLATDYQASGQFLARGADLPVGTSEVAIGVCPVAAAPSRAESVLAQLCVLFT